MICLKFKLVNSLRVQKNKIKKKKHCRSFQIPKNPDYHPCSPYLYTHPHHESSTLWKSTQVQSREEFFELIRTHPVFVSARACGMLGLYGNPGGLQWKKQSQNWKKVTFINRQDSFVTASKQDPNYTVNIWVFPKIMVPQNGWLMVYNGKP